MINKLNNLCGEGQYDLEDDFNNYSLNITTRFDDIKKYDELNKMLKQMIPANLGVRSINVINPKLENSLYLIVGSTQKIQYTIEAKKPEQVFNIYINNVLEFNKMYILGG